MNAILQARRPYQIRDAPTPCEFEKSRPQYEDREDGTVQETRFWYCFHYFECGRRSTCPYPARLCRPKMEAEG